MEARALTHSLASVSGLQRCTPSLNSRLLPQLRQRAPLRVAAVASGLSRDAGSSSATSFPPQLGLNAPSAEEAAAPVALVHSPEEFQQIIAANPGKLLVLMCKATHCRPCKMFGRKYARAAQQYTDAVFLEIFGDETKDTRQMMIDMSIKVTPTFVLFRGGAKVHSHGGINETNLHRYVSKFLEPGEAGYGTFSEPAEGSA